MICQKTKCLNFDPACILEGAGAANADFKRVLRPDESPTIVDTWKEMEKLLDTGSSNTIPVIAAPIHLLHVTPFIRKSQNSGCFQFFDQDTLTTPPSLQNYTSDEPSRVASMSTTRRSQRLL